MSQDQTLQFLKGVSFFAHLPDEVLTDIAAGIEQRLFAKHDIVFREGDEADGMYIIIFGQAEVAIGKKLIARLGIGDFFGEIALITKEPRNGSIGIVSETCSTLFVSKELFEKIKYKVSPKDQAEVIRRIKENQDRGLGKAKS